MQRRVLLINSKLNKQKQNQQKQQLKKKHNRGNRTLSMNQYSELKKT